MITPATYKGWDVEIISYPAIREVTITISKGKRVEVFQTGRSCPLEWVFGIIDMEATE